MLLEDKNAIIYGAAGAVGGACVRSRSARIFLTGRNPGALAKLAEEILAAGGLAETAEFDGLDEQAVANHVDAVVEKAGAVDVSFNAIGIPQQGIQGIPLTELTVDSFMLPVITYSRAHFVTVRAAARRMTTQKFGVILLHTPEAARAGTRLVGWPSLQRSALLGIPFDAGCRRPRPCRERAIALSG